MTTSEARMLLVPIRNEYKAKSERSISQFERDIYAMLTEAIEMGMDALEKLPSARPDNSCDGCRYENADDGVLVPCGFCKRSHSDNYERRTDE